MRRSAHSQEFLNQEARRLAVPYADPELPSEIGTRLKFDDEDWRSGQSGFGYGDGDGSRTEQHVGQFDSVLTSGNRSKSMTPPSSRSLYLYLNFDDGSLPI